jgi:hypothetical protein
VLRFREGAEVIDATHRQSQALSCEYGVNVLSVVRLTRCQQERVTGDMEKPWKFQEIHPQATPINQGSYIISSLVDFPLRIEKIHTYIVKYLCQETRLSYILSFDLSATIRS